MNYLFNITIVLSLIFFSYQLSFCQKHTARKNNRILTRIKTWVCINIERETPHHGMLVGELLFEFSKKKHAPINGLFQATHNDKIHRFDYLIKNDSIQFSFEETKKWTDYEIISLNKKKLLLKQNIENNLFLWTFIPKKVQLKKKKRHPNSR